MPVSGNSDVFTYLSVLISIVIGFGMSQILAGVVRVLHHRRSAKIYWPTLLWALNLFLLLTLVWWSDFSLLHHDHWTFAIFLTTLALPTVLYINASLLLPGSERAANASMESVYADNRRLFFGLQSVVVALSFFQTYLLDGHIAPGLDTSLKVGVIFLTIVPIFSKAEGVQRAIAVANFAWLLFYVGLLFANVRTA